MRERKCGKRVFCWFRLSHLSHLQFLLCQHFYLIVKFTCKYRHTQIQLTDVHFKHTHTYLLNIIKYSITFGTLWACIQIPIINRWPIKYSNVYIINSVPFRIQLKLIYAEICNIIFLSWLLTLLSRVYVCCMQEKGFFHAHCCLISKLL